MEPSGNNAYFQFSRRERHGILAILFILLFFLMLPYLYLFIDQREAAPQASHNIPIGALEDSILYAMENPDSTSVISATGSPRARPALQSTLLPRPYYFDPNKIDISGWIALGLPEKTARTIERYRSKGGRFRQPGDLDKIWGMDPALAERLKPYVTIKPDATQASQNYASAWRKAERQPYQPRIIDINLADSAAWESLPGIGPSLARRIVSFRNRLGGFYSVEQVGETFGLPDSVFRRVLPSLTCKAFLLKRIPINTAGVEELKSHPYIRYKLANALDAYRKQHGPFQAVSDIRQVMLVTDSVYQKLSPYLVLG
jgi:DNA uptake protein ComE-like DNA-binding protein